MNTFCIRERKDYFAQRRRVIANVRRQLDEIRKAQSDACHLPVQPEEANIEDIEASPEDDVAQNSRSDDKEGCEDDVYINTASDSDDYDSEECNSEEYSIISSDSDNDGSLDSVADDSRTDLKSKLAQWCIDYSVKNDASTALLHILRDNGHMELPKDSRTLKKTPRDIELKDLAGGQYYHFGLETSIQHVLSDKKLTNGQLLRLQINVDGLPVHKSTNCQLWPILGLLYLGEDKISDPFCIGIWCGNSKPNSCGEYLHDFVKEYLAIQNKQHITVGEANVKIWLWCIICDSPARAFVKNVKPHNAYHGCCQCETRGRWEAHRMTFPNLKARNRTNNSFRTKRDTVHHKGSTPLEDINIDLVGQIPPDYMHCLLLGIMRKIMHMLTKGRNLKHRLGPDDVDKITQAMLKCARTCPKEFSRRPRTLKELDRFKATEFRMLLCYVGVVALKGVLTWKKYSNFLLLACASRIMLNSETAQSHNLLAQRLANAFVDHFMRIYGSSHAVYNVHMLIHLPNAARNFGNLDKISSFPFENYLHTLKMLVRKSGGILQQVVHRIVERRNPSLNESLFSVPGATQVQYLKEHHSYSGISDERHFEGVVVGGVRYSTSKRDSIVKLGKDICSIQGVVLANKELMLSVKIFRSVRDFFTYPVCSSAVGIHLVGQLGHRAVRRPLKDARKCWLLPYKTDLSVVAEMTSVTL